MSENDRPPSIGLNLGLRLDGLSLLFALLITGIGLLTGLTLFTRGTNQLLNIAGRLTTKLETTSLQRYIAWMLMATPRGPPNCGCCRWR